LQRLDYFLGTFSTIAMTIRQAGWASPTIGWKAIALRQAVHTLPRGRLADFFHFSGIWYYLKLRLAEIRLSLLDLTPANRD
jgi:hypothetical protein